LSSRLSLFCIPHAGGGASAYRRWAEALSPNIDVRVLQLAGREARFRETALDDLDAVIADLWSAVQAETSGPFALFGHSFGSLLAFELAHEIRRRTGREPVHLFVSASPAPQARQVRTPLSDLTDAEFVADIAARYGGMPVAILQDADYLAVILPALRADFRMLERYRCAARDVLGCPISVFSGAADSIIPATSLDGWADHTGAEFSLDVLDGDHFYLQAQRVELARLIKEKLARASVPRRDETLINARETVEL
jgi:medium-chain acyl-[acyl-carrier-protein] hydrolase